MTADQTAVRLERTLPAPPTTVYRAWLEPDLLRRWMAPGSMEVTRAEVDERVGGRFRIWQVDGDTDVGGFECELLELVPDQRLVFRWGFVGPDRTDGPTFDSLLTVTFRAAPGGGTALTLVHERLADLAAAMPHVAENVGTGWELALTKLTAVLGSPTTGRKVIASDWISLDGVAQGPSSPDEDTSGGFMHGGWHLRYFDDVSRKRVVDDLDRAGGFLFERRTYELFAAHWPTASAEEQVLAQPLNTKPKYVASTTLTEPLAWQNSTLLQGDLAQAVTALKQQGGGDLLVIGSTNLVHALLAHDLVDEFRLMIDPVILGSGKRLFSESATPTRLRLVHSQETSTGAILATYGLAIDD